MQQWEQRVLHFTATDWKGLNDKILELGVDGWEAVSITSADKTVGMNAMLAIIRRPVVTPDPMPAGTPEGWHPDPCGRWEIRHWNGERWTAHVADSHTKKRGIDFPTMLPPPQ